MKKDLSQWENYGIGFNASLNDDGYVCIDSDVSLIDTAELSDFIMNTPAPPRGEFYFEMSLNDRLDFGYLGKPYIAPLDYKSFIDKYPKYEKSFLRRSWNYTFRKRSMKALEHYIDYVREKDGGLIISG